MPLSATATTSSGIAAASASDVSSDTASVRRSRLLTPTSRAPAASARSSSRALVDLDERVDAHGPRLAQQLAQLGVVERGDDQQHRVRARGARLPDLPGIER